MTARIYRRWSPEWVAQHVVMWAWVAACIASAFVVVGGVMRLAVWIWTGR